MAVLRLAAFLLALGGCSEPCEHRTLILATSVKVVDMAGGPVAGLAHSTVRLSTGEDVTPRDGLGFETQYPGTYLILEGTVDVGTAPESFRFEAHGLQGRVELTFAAWTDDCSQVFTDTHANVLVLQ